MKDNRNNLANQLDTMLQGQTFTPELGLEMHTDGLNIFTLAHRSDERSACTLRLRIHLDGWDKNNPDEVIAEVRKEVQEGLDDQTTSYTARQMLDSLDRPRIDTSLICGVKLSLTQTLPDGIQIQRQATTDEDGIAQFNFLIWDAPCQMEVVNQGNIKFSTTKTGDTQVAGFDISISENQENPQKRDVTVIAPESEKELLIGLVKSKVVWLSRKEGNHFYFHSVDQGEFELIIQLTIEEATTEQDEVVWAADSASDPKEQIEFRSPDGTWRILLQPGEVNQSDITICCGLESVRTPKISISIGPNKGHFYMKGSGSIWNGNVTLDIAFDRAKKLIPEISVETS